MKIPAFKKFLTNPLKINGNLFEKYYICAPQEKDYLIDI
jgi:hypothetical protein